MISIIALLLSVAFGLGKGTKMVRRNEELRTMNRALLKALRELQVGAGEDCWQESTEGVDLAPGQWTGSGGTSFEQCKSNAEAAGVLYFAWTGEVYEGYCKILNSGVTSPNLATNQGYGYNLWLNNCQIGCVPCKCNMHDPTADPAYTDCGATDDSAFWRYGPSYINCYEPSNRQGKYEFKLYGSCPEKGGD